MQGHQLFAVNIGLDLAPQYASRPAARGANLLHRNPEFLEDLEGIAQAEGHAFQDRTYQVPAVVGRGQPKPHPASLRVQMRRALAHQIGKKQQAVAAGRSLFCLLDDHVVGIGTGLARVPGLRLPEVLAEPAQRQAGTLRDAHHVPFAGDGMAEGVNAPLRVELGRRRVCEDDARGAKRCRGQSRQHNPVAYSAGRLIASPRDHRCAGCESGHERRLTADLPGDLRRLMQPRHQRLIDLKQ